MATPLCVSFADLRVSAPERSLRDYNMDLFRLLRCRPIRDPALIRGLKCSKFAYQPVAKNPWPLFFASIEAPESLRMNKIKHLIDHPSFIAKYGAFKLKKLRNRCQHKTRRAKDWLYANRLHLGKKSRSSASTTPRSTRQYASYKAPLPTSPFDAVTKNDAFELFPELRHPPSAFRSDSSSYNEQLLAAEQAEDEKPLQRGSPLDRVDMVQRALRHGPWEDMRTPTRPHKHQRPLPRDYSPMVVD